MSNIECMVSREEIAIVGMAGRFPRAKNIDEFWRNLCKGVVSIKPFTIAQLKASGVDKATLENPSFVNSGAFIEDADCFDATFFGFSPLEAEIMDPQHRLFLECAWEAIENAGYNPETFNGPIGVFGGVSPNTYFQNTLMTRPDLLKKVGPQLTRLSNEKDNAATRVSFKLNLKGPSISVQTNCSSSGVALHLACQSVLSGECDMALVGGARIEAPLHAGYWYEEGGILSPDGHCKVFDAEARGTVFGNGVAMIVIKRLSDAIRDGDSIQAVIKAAAINNDGSSKVGYLAPSVQGQASVIEEALTMAEVSPDTIGYIEAHGTGTPLGDPIEVAALTTAFRKWTNRKGYCRIGSVKANIGHLFAGAGVAGVIKTVLTLKHKQIPPSPNFIEPNPQIDFENSPFYVSDKLSEWQAGGTPRRAGVSSFGVGGTNAHIILEEAPETEPSGPSRHQQLLLSSAKSDGALENATANLVEHLKEHPHLNLADVAYTLNSGRKTFDYRRMIVCQDLNDAVATLETLDPERVLTFFQEPINQNTVFMFSGQGSQYVDMGLELYETESEFREHIDRCSEILQSHLSLDLRDILYPKEGNIEELAQHLKQTSITQPALFTIEYSLAKLWMSWGVQPAALVGHSIGEYVAACLAGVFSLEDALSLVATRGRLMQELPGGSMLAVPLSEKDIEQFLNENLSLSAVNSPSICTVSGENEAVEDLEEELSKNNINCRHLHTSHAFHSKMMDPIIDAFVERAKQVNFDTPRIPIVSTVTGTWVTSDEIMAPVYWAKNLRQTVRFSDCVQELLKEPNRVLLEVGPGQTLSTLVRQHSNESKEQIVLSSIRHPQEHKSDTAFILDTLGRLWLSGIQVNWPGFYKDERRHRVPLPTYSFERQRYWVEPQKPVQATTAAQKFSSKKADLDEWFYIPSWKRFQLPKPHGKKVLAEHKLRWLVFLDECGFGAKLVRRLQQEGQRVTTVKVSTKLSQVGEEAYTINAQAQEDYQSLLKELRATERAPDTIVHLWCLTSAEGNYTGSDVLEISQNLGFNSLLFLTQAIDDQLAPEPVQIKVISNNLQEVTGEEVLFPEKAILLGPCRVTSQEYPNIQCTSIDMLLPKADAEQEQLLDLLMEELSTKTSEPIVAYRGKHRWVQIFEAIRLQKTAELKTRVRENGVYLITGGLGGIGLTLAEYLSQTVRAKLVLIARTILPARDEWDEWLKTHDAQDTISRKIRNVQSIEELGAEVLVLSADVSDMIQMKAAIAQTYDRFGPIHGVVHAAGVAGGGIMQLKTLETAEGILAPKVNGTLVLAKLLNESKLDFFVLCSSIDSVLGGVGQVDYCAANAFLDAYAHKHNSKNGAISINWCAWQEVGMAVNTAVPEDLKEEREQSLKFGILPEEGKEAFSRILDSSFPQVVVSTQDFLPRMDLSKKSVASGSVEKTMETASLKPTYARPNLSSVYVVPGNPTEQTIAEVWQQVLGIEKVGIHDNFFDLGGHSLLVAKVIAHLRSAFPVEFPMGSLFERPTVHLLSKMILEEQKRGPSFVESSSRGRKRKERRLRR